MSAAIEFTPGNVKAAMAGVKSGDLWNVPFDLLYIQPGFNVREEDDPSYAEHIDNLERLIEANGYDRTKAFEGYIAKIDGEDRVVVTDGHSRYRAISRLRARDFKIETVPLITKSRGTSMEDLTFGLANSNSGRRLTPYELGTLCKRLVGFGVESEVIQKRLNITGTYLDDLLFLHSAPKAVRDMVRTGKVAAGVAISTCRKHGDKAVEMLREAVQVAAASGKKKATAKHLAPDWSRECKKAGPKLYDGLMWVREDAGYSKLSKDTREFIEQLISNLPPEPIKETKK